MIAWHDRPQLTRDFRDQVCNLFTLTVHSANYKMFLKYVPVFRVAVLLLALATYGVQVIGEDTLVVTESDKDASAETSASNNWIEDLLWNLLGYATIIIPAAFIIRMLKNSNFNERTGELLLHCIRVPSTYLKILFRGLIIITLT